jgi:ribosomal protein S18 acetylase RimI-like enzyme
MWPSLLVTLLMTASTIPVSSLVFTHWYNKAYSMSYGPSPIKSGFQSSSSTLMSPLWAATTEVPWESSVEEVPTVPVGVDIRPAEVADLKHVVELRIDVFYPELRAVRSFYDKILGKLTSRREKGAQCLVAVHDETGTILGTIEFSYSDFADTSMADIGYERKLYLMDLAVLPKARRMGIATLLLNTVEKYAQENDFRDIYLHVEVDNKVARDLYEKNGFQEILPLNWAISFTEGRLHKPWEQYVLLLKNVF